MTGVINKNSFLFTSLAVLFVAMSALAAVTETYLLLAIPFIPVLFYAGWQNRNLVFLLLLFAIPLSFEYNFSPELATDVPDELLMIFVSGLFVACWVYSPKVIDRKILSHPLFILLLAVLGWTILSILFSSYPLISLKFILAKCWYIGAFVLAPLIIFKEKKYIRIAAATLAVAMMLVTFFILVRHSASGFRFADINEATAPFFRNHVNYSALLVCVVPILVSFYYAAGKTKQKSLLGVVILIALAALFFSYARGAWAALLAGLTAYWAIKRKLLLPGYIIGIITVIAAVFWLKKDDRYLQYANDYNTTIFHTNFSEHLIATYKLKDVSTAERFYRWIAGVRMIKDNWLTGYGPNTFYHNYKEHAVPAFKTWVSNNSDRSTVHNYFLLTAIEQGIPGLLLLLILVGAMLYYAQYLYHRVKDTFYKAVALTTGVIITMLLVVNMLSDLIETDKIGSIFFLSLAVLVAADVNTRRTISSPSH